MATDDKPVGFDDRYEVDGGLQQPDHDDTHPEAPARHQTDSEEKKPAPSQYPSALPPSHYEDKDD